MVVLFYVPTSNVWGFQFLHILTNTWYRQSFFYYTYSIGYAVISHCQIVCIFLISCWVHFLVLISHSYVFCGKVLNQIFCLFLFFLLGHLSFIVLIVLYSEYKPFIYAYCIYLSTWFIYRYMIYIFSQSVAYVSIFLVVSFVQKYFILMKSELDRFFYYGSYFGCLI